MYSNWNNPLPQGELASQQAMLCTYEGKWLPLMSIEFHHALSICKKVLLEGYEVFIFPTSFHPGRQGVSIEVFTSTDPLGNSLAISQHPNRLNSALANR